MTAEARFRKPPNSLRRRGGCARPEREAKGRDRPRSGPIGMAREALVEVERRLAATQRSWGPPPYGGRADCSFLRRETDPHPVFLDKPTRPLDAAAAAWRHDRTSAKRLLAVSIADAGTLTKKPGLEQGRANVC